MQLCNISLASYHAGTESDYPLPSANAHFHAVSILLAGQLQILILISPTLIMDSFQNGKQTGPL